MFGERVSGQALPKRDTGGSSNTSGENRPTSFRITVMTREEVREAFEKAGWRISDRTNYHLLVGEAENPSLSLLAHEEAIGAANPVFEIVDRERNATLRVRSIPTPTQAVALLEEQGGLPEEV